MLLVDMLHRLHYLLGDLEGLLRNTRIEPQIFLLCKFHLLNFAALASSAPTLPLTIMAHAPWHSRLYNVNFSCLI
jgi:hypothetical protein